MVLALAAQETALPDATKLQQMAARFEPTRIGADLSKLSDADRRVLAKLIEASKIIDALFLRQVWAGNEAMLVDLARDDSTDGRARLHYFLINKGPWSRLDHNQPFVRGAPPKPEAANFYPPGASKADVERWIQSLPEAARPRATGFFNVIRNPIGAPNGYSIVPYNIEFQGELALAAGLLREAAEITHEPTLKTFPTNRGVQTAACNLPNDERVVREKGTKRVMLKNVQDAKFAKTLVPISKIVLSPSDQQRLSFDAFFTHIVVHELMHGLGPHNITIGG